MRKLIYICVAFMPVLLGCGSRDFDGGLSGVREEEYDFEALRDTLGLGPECIFVKECSPLYHDENPYGYDPDLLMKTMFYKITYDSMDNRPDTMLYMVSRSNNIQLIQSNRQHGTVESWGWWDHIQETIDWYIKNRRTLKYG